MMKSGKKLRADKQGGKVATNYVHELIEILESHFREEGHARQEFATAAFAGALRFLEEISEAKDIPTYKRIALLAKIYEAANKKIEKLAGEPFENIPLWADRGRNLRKISPCDWVRRHYPTYGKGLTMDQIRDAKLRQALWTYKSKYGWPDDFDLPGKSVTIKRLLEDVGPTDTLAGLDDLPPRSRRDRRRAWQIRYQRLKK
ncbi:hypothetical protein ACQR0Z_30245 [Bradyrhizobium sp. HKCCYLS3077]|uniref:hypothetical protein n=1 Tax=Bradyrhizobium sp. HKCCYLS3077 TaxID=3420761 RepID=UPI003EBBEBBC